jgi:hypothetical protein
VEIFLFLFSGFIISAESMIGLFTAVDVLGVMQKQKNQTPRYTAAHVASLGGLLMNQDQQPRIWWKDHRLAWALAALALIGLLITVILGYLLNWGWTGLVGAPENPETRTAWDWLGLLIIPLVIALATLWFNNQTRKSEQELAHK